MSQSRRRGSMGCNLFRLRAFNIALQPTRDKLSLSVIGRRFGKFLGSCFIEGLFVMAGQSRMPLKKQVLPVSSMEELAFRRTASGTECGSDVRERMNRHTPITAVAGKNVARGGKGFDSFFLKTG